MLEYKLDDDLDANQLRTQVKQQPINESFNYYQGFQLQQLFFFEHKEIFCVKLLGKVIETTTKRGSFKGIITKTSK